VNEGMISEAVERGLSEVAHQISGLHTGHPGDNPLMAAFDSIAQSNNNIAEAIRELARALENHNL
jgi:hypothetical protein